MNKCMVAPSILACDFANVQRDVEMLNESEADYIHIDIMDGVFVPNLSFGFPVTQAIAKHARKPLDFHLMIQHADPYLAMCRESGADIITVHLEAVTHLHRTVSAIKELGAKAGVALNPHTPVSLLEDLIQDLDLVLIMSVNPGFGGQKFIPQTLAKVEKLAQMAQLRQPELLIEVDGGVSAENAADLVSRGANMLVAGSFIFKSDDPKSTIRSLKSVE